MIDLLGYGCLIILVLVEVIKICILWSWIVDVSKVD